MAISSWEDQAEEGLNQANPFLKGLDAKAFLNNRGLGLEASGVLFITL
jgi:hypothetical protein